MFFTIGVYDSATTRSVTVEFDGFHVRFLHTIEDIIPRYNLANIASRWHIRNGKKESPLNTNEKKSELINVDIQEK